MQTTRHRRSTAARLGQISARGLIMLGLAGLFAVAPAALAATPPDAPTGIAASAGNASATVTWSPPIDNGGPAVTSYIVIAAGSGSLPPPVEVTATTAQIDGLANGTTYTFTVLARNVDGDSPE